MFIKFPSRSSSCFMSAGAIGCEPDTIDGNEIDIIRDYK
jgi:hypothetical protein